MRECLERTCTLSHPVRLQQGADELIFSIEQKLQGSTFSKGVPTLCWSRRGDSRIGRQSGPVFMHPIALFHLPLCA